MSRIKRYSFPANTTVPFNLYYTLTTNEENRLTYIGNFPEETHIYRPNFNRMYTKINDMFLVDSYIDRKYYGDNITEEYLNTNIVGKEVYAPISGCGYYLYTENYLPYHIVNNKSEVIDSNGSKYVKVQFTSEKTLGDLYKHSWWYSYDYHTDSFLELPEKGKIANLMRYVIQSNVLRIAGTAEDRLADYGRVIAFLLSKVNLTEEERNILQPFIDQAPDINTLAAISDKEREIRRLVKFAHDNPLEFLAEQYGDLHAVVYKDDHEREELS